MGLGLAYRWAKAGYRIVLGSRESRRAQEAADALRGRVPDAEIRGATNLEAATLASILVLTLPASAKAAILEELGPVLPGKLLIDTTVPLVPPSVDRVSLPSLGSAALETQRQTWVQESTSWQRFTISPQDP